MSCHLRIKVPIQFDRPLTRPFVTTHRSPAEEEEEEPPTEPTGPGPFAGRMIILRVGSPPTEFTVHEQVLKAANKARSFKNALKKSAFNSARKRRRKVEAETSEAVTNDAEAIKAVSTDANTHIYNLPDDDPLAFRVLLNWIYGDVAGFIICEKKEFFQNLSTTTLLKLYVLAYKYKMHALHDAIITHLWCQQKTGKCWLELSFTQDDFSHFEAHTAANCHLDKLLAAWMADDAVKHRASEFRGLQPILDFTPDRLMRAAFTALNHVNGDSRYYGSSWYYSFIRQVGVLCSYHIHGQDQPCSAPVTLTFQHIIPGSVGSLRTKLITLGSMNLYDERS